MSYLTLVGAIFITWLILVALFAPHIPYHIETGIDAASDHFVHVIESTCNTKLKQHNRIEILADGARFYPAMLEAIRSAEETINLECYIFRKGEIAQQFVDALGARARAGVRVTLVLDAIGSLGAIRWCTRQLRAAGCRVEPYQRLRWYTLARLNNRTHRELLVVDGTVAFIGGPGIGDWWWKGRKGKPPWRDMMARVEGPVVSDIQGVIAENWLECTGEILTGVDSYKTQRRADGSPAFVVKSSPADRATASRVLFQTLIEAATRRVLIATPYFLPDKAFRRAICRTSARGVELIVIVPGPHTDQRWVRLASRRMYGRLFDAGVRIFEYMPGMTHAKALLVDDLWAVIGTTNVDNRSFEHNDEANLAIRDPAVAARLTEDFRRDLGRSAEVTREQWRRRPRWEKLAGTVAWILERQQ
ncbi:MAG: cardiolipin synthase B [Acidobacteria bacterium]|nr:cardiolipin synthase B [Acidobacteriota bacterium]